MANLNVTLNRLSLRNPILVASGTFGYARETAAFIDFSKLGGIIPKTVTPLPRAGNPPPRTIETSCGMLNSIGLDNDGIDYFIEKYLDYLLSLDCPIIANVAGHNAEEFQQLAERLNDFPQLAAVELNISCPNVSGGVDFATNPELTHQVVSSFRNACDLPVIAKLTPNVTNVIEIAQAAADGGADAVTLINTLLGMAIDLDDVDEDMRLDRGHCAHTAVAGEGEVAAFVDRDRADEASLERLDVETERSIGDIDASRAAR